MAHAPSTSAGAAPVHSPAYMRRRFFNWFPLGLTYALLYMGRYNLTVSKTALGDLMSKADFGNIFGVGAWVYALAFLVNGPITDKIGGKRAMLIGAAGSAAANLAMGLYVAQVLAMPDPKAAPLALVFSVLYGVNMYFQSYGAVAIVKVNAHWFHVRERGTFSGIFGIMISTGLFLAFDVCTRILKAAGEHGYAGAQATRWVFLIPAALLAAFFLLESVLLKDRPSEAGYADFETGDADTGEDHSKPLPVTAIIKQMLTHRVVMTIALVEFCTGVIRNGIMHWYLILAKERMAAGMTGGWKYMSDNWGLILMVAGVVGGVAAGTVSDRLFQSRRAPAAGFLYALCAACALLMLPALNGEGWAMGLLVFLMSIAVIGTHGLLSGTATMDFGGRRGAATATGIIDGFVYLGTGLQSVALGHITSKSWTLWPVFLAPFAFAGFALLRLIWDAKPGRAPAQAAKSPAGAPEPA